MAQGPNALNARPEVLMQYETIRLRRVQDQMISAVPTLSVYTLDEEDKPRPIKLDIETYSG